VLSYYLIGCDDEPKLKLSETGLGFLSISLSLLRFILVVGHESRNVTMLLIQIDDDNE